jgi:hypothetical protein
MAAKTFQARVDQITTDQLLAIQRADGLSDSQIVQRALKLIIDEADKNLATLERDAIDKARAMGNFLAGKEPSPPQSSRSRTADDEVGPGGKTFQARIKDPDVDRLLAIAHIQGWSESQLVRRGLKLLIEEASRDITHLLEKLDAEYQTARRALEKNLSPTPRVKRQPADQDTAPSVTTSSMPSDAIKVGAQQHSASDLGR